MARRIAKEMTVEEFQAWSKASRNFKKVAEAADEEGGPRLSLVPVPEQNIAWPTDLLPPAGSSGQSSADAPAVAAMPLHGVPLDHSRNRLAGWSAERQRLLLTALAETGSVHLASGS